VDFVANAPETTDTLLNPATAAQIQLANLLVKGRKFEEAVTACLDFLRKFSDHPVAVRAIITQLAAMYRGNKQIDPGQAKLQELAAQYQQNHDVRITVTTALVDLAMAKGDLQAAYAAALRLKVDPAQDKLTALSYIAMGNTFLKTDHPADARDAFQKMLAAFPNDDRNTPVALTGLGTALLKLNQPAEAETHFRKVITEHPRHVAVQGAQLGLGQIAEERGQIDDAVRAYDAAGARSARNETEQEAAFRLGKLFHLKKNDPKAALTMYGRLLLTNSPLAEEAAFRSAQCHKALCLGGERGACEVARRSFQSYLTRFKTNGRFLTEAQEELAALPPPPPPPPGG
jgi:tetratricopeptide (TPR) repeat protein